MLHASFRIRLVRSPVLHRWLHPWACLAMLLVVVAPLISRALVPPMAGSVQAMDAHAGHHQGMEQLAPQPAEAHPMHHDMGHGVDHPMPVPPAEPTDPHAEHEMGVDCEYCLIAARMISLLVAVLLLMGTWPAVLRALDGLVSTRCIRVVGTLGARGPPGAVVC